MRPALLLCLFWILQFPHPFVAAESPVVLKDLPWYDRDADQLRPVTIPPRSIEERNRMSRWDPRPYSQTTTSNSAIIFSWMEFLSRLLLILIAAAAVGVLAYGYLQRKPADKSTDGIVRAKRNSKLSESRIEQLPISVACKSGDLLAEAKMHALAGRFDVAIIFLFGQTLLQLDRKHRIRLTLGKTNGQYLRELRHAQDLLNPTAEIVETFEASYFGRHPLGAEQFSKCMKLYEFLVATLEQPTGAKTALAHGVMVILLLAISGCRGNLNDSYGHASGNLSRVSINGFGGFREIFLQAGWRAQDDKRLSTRLERAKVLVWIPKEPELPTEEIEQWVFDWLAAKSDRTFLYIAPGPSRSVDYWRTMFPSTPLEQRMEYRRKLARATMGTELDQAGRSSNSCDWFDLKLLPVTSTFRGVGSWLPEQPLEISTTSFLERPSQKKTEAVLPYLKVTFESVLKTEKGDTLAGKLTHPGWDGGKVIVLASGSPLVNFSMADSKNRTFARNLVADCGSPDRVYFLEPDKELVIKSDDAESLATYSGIAWLTRWPISMITMHALLWGILTLLALYPIFGRPMTIQNESRADFANHLRAVAELLQATGNETDARRRIADYFRLVRNEPEIR